MNVRTRIWTDIDFERAGKQVGWVNLPHSVTRSAYGMIAIPMAVVKNGTTYYLSGNTWFQPLYGANGVHYQVVPTP